MKLYKSLTVVLVLMFALAYPIVTKEYSIQRVSNPNYEKYKIIITKEKVKEYSLFIHNPTRELMSFQMDLNNSFYLNDGEITEELKQRKSDNPKKPLQILVWEYVMNNRYDNPPLTGEQWAHSPSLFLNSIGFGYCDDSASVFSQLMRSLGYETRVWGLDGHVVAEVKVDGQWQMFDPTGEVYYFNKNKQIASVEELAKDPSLINNPINPVINPKEKPLWFDWSYSKYLADVYSSRENNRVSTYYDKNPLEDYNLIFEIPGRGFIQYPAKIEGKLKNKYNDKTPYFTNLRVRTQSIGKIKIPLVIHTIVGKGKVKINDQVVSIGSKKMKDLINERDTFIKDVEIIENPSGIDILYLVNPQTIKLREQNTLELKGKGLDKLRISVKKPSI